MKKIISLLSLSIFCFSFQNQYQSIDFVSVYLNSEGKTIGVDNKEKEFIFCPGSGVPCTATLTLNGETHVITGSKGKGRASIELYE